MRMLRRLATGVLVASLVLLVACSSRPVHIAQNNGHVDTANVDFTKGRKISGSASGFQLLLLIPISINSRQNRAYQEMLAQADGEYVTDVRINESWTYAVVGTIYKTTMEAMAYPITAGASTSPPPGN